MFKLFRTKNAHLVPILKTQVKNPKFHMPISQFHNPNKTLDSNPAIKFILDEAEELESSKATEPNTQLRNENHELSRQSRSKGLSMIQISHPWPEWVELMEQLLKRGYFEGIGNPFQRNELDTKDSNQIRTACLNFARRRFDILRYLSRQDILVIAGSGCPSIDRKVVNSGKRLRMHVGIDEGNVCSSCILRGSCERSYVKAREDEGVRTVDVMRFLLMYVLDPIIGSVENKPCLNKRVKESVRSLLKEMLEFILEERDCDPPKAISSTWNSSAQGSSTFQGRHQINVPMMQGDWICPKCNFLNFSRNIKCLRCDGLFQERLSKLEADQDHLPLKKGDWICDKCNFLNFAKNTRCFQCTEKPTMRQLNPGEWECESCNYLNFRRNSICLKCDHRRPKALNFAGLARNGNGDQHQIRTYFGQERLSGDKGVADMWKFVEDENGEQDGSNSWNEIPEFIDFPVAGGKSDLSCNVEKQERWKIEMRERSNARARENADEFKSAVIQRSYKFDDQKVGEWFECGGSKN